MNVKKTVSKLMKNSLMICAFLLAMTGSAQTNEEKTNFAPPAGKEIYIPRDLKDNDFTKEDSKWSFARMAYTDDVIVFWEKPFGKHPSTAPDLEGHNMKVDIDNLLFRLQSYYDYFKNKLDFIHSGSKAEKYRMMVMLNYSLEGTAYGGDYDQQIGALWIAPNRVQDKKLNCIAHELGHSFQSQIGCDGEGESWGGGGIFEMTSQWMLWHVNPEWTTDENFHWKGFIDNHFRRFLAIENIYHSPFVLEHWAMKRGVTVIADLFRQGKRGEDPASTYMRMFNLTVDEMNNEMTEGYCRLLTFDFPRVKESHKKFVGELVTPVTVDDAHSKMIIRPAEGKTPQTWGFNAIELNGYAKKGSLSLNFKGLNSDTNAEYKTCLVEVDENGNAQYGDIKTGYNQKYKVKKLNPQHKLYLVVVGCPKNTYKPFNFNPYDRKQKKEPEAEFPYEISVSK